MKAVFLSAAALVVFAAPASAAGLFVRPLRAIKPGAR